MHWIGAKFCVCLFLDSGDKSLNMLKYLAMSKENERTNEEEKILNKS